MRHSATQLLRNCSRDYFRRGGGEIHAATGAVATHAMRHLEFTNQYNPFNRVNSPDKKQTPGVQNRYDRRVTAVQTPEAGFEALRGEDPDLIMLDVKIPGSDGLEILKQIRNERPRQMVVIMTAHGSTETAINATSERFREILIELKVGASAGATLATANVPAAISRG